MTDFQKDLRELTRLNAQAREHAERAIQAIDSGDQRRAETESAKAATYLRKARAIEKRYPQRNPHE